MMKRDTLSFNSALSTFAQSIVVTDTTFVIPSKHKNIDRKK